MMPETLQLHQEKMFYDPFAENAADNFKPLNAHAAMWKRYHNREVKHDYTADQFVADTNALLMDTHFLGRYKEAEMIAASMHAGCIHDHTLSQSLEENSSTSTYLNSASNEHAGHDHSDKKRSSEADTDAENKDKKKNDKKKKLKPGWLSRLFRG